MIRPHEEIIAATPTVQACLSRWAQGERVAYRDETGDLSFRSLLDAGRELALRLVAMDPQRKRPLAYLGRQRNELYVLMVAAAYARMPLAALNWRLSAAELGAVLADARPSLIVVDAPFSKLLESTPLPVPTIVIAAEGAQSLVEALPNEHGTLEEARPDDCLLLVYTSGTTGKPKGVMLSHRALILSIAAFAITARVHPDARVLVQAPTFHVSGSVFGLLGPLNGGLSHLSPTAGAPEIAATVRREALTHVTVVPTVLRDLLQVERDAPGSLASLECIVYGAAPIDPGLLREATNLLDCGFAQSFGLSESVGCVAMLDPDEHDPDRPRLLESVGKAMPWTEFRVVDPSSGLDVEPGGVGELWVRGPRTMIGYWNAPEATAAALDAQGWLRTGDLVSIDGDYAYLSGRLKDMIISGGENIYSIEVENALLSHADVTEAAVVGLPDEKWGEVPVAMVVTRGAVGSEALREHCRSRIAHYKVPARVVIVESLPRNQIGKILKHEVRRLLVAGDQRA